MPEIDESVTDESTESTDIEQVEEPEESPEDPAERPTDAYKQKWENQRKVNRDLEAKLKKLTADAEMQGKPEGERALAEKIREAREEATTKANERIVRAEVKAAAAGKVKNPALALKLIDTSAIEVDDDGEVDADALNAAIDDLLTEYPELAADASKFGGGADQGAKGKASKPSQLSKQELSKLSPAEVLKAREDGRLDALLGK